MNPEAKIEIRDTEHFFYRLDRFQDVLEAHAKERNPIWKPNVRAMTKQWLEMGLRPRAVTRDLDWGIPLPLEGAEWEGKCVYVWFEAVIGYLSASMEWAQSTGQPEAWRAWWEGDDARSVYFIGKDNIPFHTIIWPGMLLGYGGLNLPTDVPANST